MSKRYVIAVFSVLFAGACASCGDESMVIPVVPNECEADACDKDDNMRIKRCVAGHWRDERCNPGFACEIGEAGKAICRQSQTPEPSGECSPPAAKCSGEKIIACGEDKNWGAPADCPTPGDICQTIDNVDKCAPKVTECAPPAAKCYGEKIIACGEDKKWGAPTDCPTPGDICQTIDNVDKCAPNPKECAPPEAICSGKQIIVCGEDQKWGAPADCPTHGDICQTIDNVAQCAPDPNDCAPPEAICSGGQIIACGNDQKWVAPSDCPNPGDICQIIDNVAQCAPKPKECEEGEIKCFDAGSGLQTNLFYPCDGQYWGNLSMCDPGKTCAIADGVHKCETQTVPPELCQKDAIACVDPGNGAAYKTCVALPGGGTDWSETTSDCPAGQRCFAIDGADQCAVCPKGATKCADGAAQSVLACNDGKEWTPVLLCLKDNFCAETAAGSAQCVTCLNGSKRCNAIAKTPQIEICDNYQWKQLESCAGRTCIGNEEGIKTPKCVDCKPDGIKRCKGTVVQTCGGNAWIDGEDCKHQNKVCDAATFKCVEEQCADGAAKCDDKGNFFICESKSWVKRAECGAKDQCIGAASAANAALGCKCAKDALVCDAEKNNVMKCQENKLGVKTYMSLVQNEVCKAGMCTSDSGNAKKAYCKCDNGAFECASSVGFRYCKDGKWTAGSCAASTVCDARLGTCNSQCNTSAIASKIGRCSAWDRLTCAGSEDGRLVKAETCAQGCEYSSLTLKPIYPIDPVEPTPIPMRMTPLLLSQGTATCIDTTGASIARCAKNLAAINVYFELKNEGHWRTIGCQKGQVCAWVKPSGTGLKPILAAEEPQCVTKVCSEGAVVCSDDKLSIRQCINNAWETVGACADGLKCTAKIGGGVCGVQ